MTESLNFQSIIMVLEKFWADNGCLIWQPYHTEVGAGTMNPATSLRVLGPEPWNVGYVEPSIRPDDGRYGENPNRFYQHTQYQVILKPDPGNPQELYLKSLEALGIDPQIQDAYDFQTFIDDLHGGAGKGWFRIVTTPAQARPERRRITRSARTARRSRPTWTAARKRAR